MKKKVKIITDFDNTLSTVDLIDKLIVKIYGEMGKEIVSSWEDMKIGAVLAHKQMAESQKLTDKLIRETAKDVFLEKGIHELRDYCRENDIELIVVSDGFDVYIDDLLSRNNLSDLPVYCNEVVFRNGRIEIRHPFRSSECDFCGHCKDKIMEVLVKEGDYVIYVGDGNSDFCAAMKADVVFAKNDLLEFCEKRNLPYFEFRDFFDVLNFLKKSNV
ncbi:MAG: MtnX-like HAD-IB family phosphatase [Actinobacteria bacterium]|nr:MtnX-like HAD-IB family phosphatase [Actinomycetota bacterium]